MNRRIALIAAAGLVVASLVAASATATPTRQAREQSTRLLVGINDEASTLYGNPATAFAALKSLRTQVLRVNLYWGGNKWAVANKKPADATDPGDPAYRWAIYDRLVRYATDNKIKVVFSFLFTPGWANGNKARNVAPTNAKDLEHFAYAAAERYSGLWIPPAWQQDASLGIGGSSPLPKVTMWTAWNEPNNPLWLTPQYKRVGKTWRVQSAYEYARICNAIDTGVHAVLISPERGKVPGEQVACGVTGPKGNDAPLSDRVVHRSAHLPERGEEVRDEEVRRVRASPLCRRRGPGAKLSAEGQRQAPHPDGQPQPADGGADQTLRAEASVDH